MNLEAIRERSQECEKARDRSIGPHVSRDWSLACIASAADVPALLSEISNLRAALGEERAAHAKAGTEVQELKDLALALTEARDEARAELRRLWRTNFGGAGARSIAEVVDP